MTHLITDESGEVACGDLPSLARNMDEAPGFGLGLAITNAIVLAHDGALSLHDPQPHGLIVRMRLPLRQQSERPAA